MFKKLAWIALVVLGLALVAAIISMIVGSGSRSADLTVVIDDSELPGQLVRNPDLNPAGLEATGSSEDGSLHIYDEKTGKLKQAYFWGSIQPLPGGVFDVVKPRARYHLAENLVIEMQADNGHFVAPSERPQRGELKGNVVITVYQSPKGTRLDLASDTTPIAVKLTLDDTASFDATLGKIESKGPLRLVAPGRAPHRLLFEGRGLVMVYNEPVGRVDYLQIQEGKELRYTPTDDEPSGNQLAAQQGTQPAKSPSTSPQKARPSNVQYYGVTFEDNVKVVSAERSIDANVLSVRFGFDSGSSEQENDSRESTRKTESPVGSKPSGMSDLLGDIGSDDVSLTWTGPMTLRPLRGRPVELRQARDVVVEFLGTPAVARSARSERISCEKIVFIDREKLPDLGDTDAPTGKREQLLSAIGSAMYPLIMSGPGMGTASADELKVGLHNQTAILYGEGRLTAHADEDDARGLPAGFNVSWSRRLELTLADESEGTIKSAHFYGDVDLKEKRVKVKAGELRAEFLPAGAKKRPQLHRVHARQDVDIQAADGRITAQDLRITTQLDADGNLVPHIMHGKGNVHIRDTTQDFKAGGMKVTLGQDPTRNPQGDSTFDQQVKHIQAWEAVHLKMTDGTTIIGDRLEANAEKRSAHLIGSPVKVSRDGAHLQVLQLDLLDDGKVATARGAGQFTYTEPDRAGQPGRIITVTWSESMSYRDSINQIHVTGNVVATASDKPTQLNRMSADDLRLELTDATEGKGTEHRELKSVRASGNVVLLARQWQTAERKKMILRLRATGPELLFDNTTETATITGAGTLLAEDYRADPAGRPLASVNVTGRGATLFTWTKSMVMDGENTSFALDGKAHMSHWPASGGGHVDLTQPAVADLQCEKMSADMSGIGGMHAMRMSETDSLKLDEFNATGGVQLRHHQNNIQRVISCQTMTYDAVLQQVNLLAMPGREVEIMQTDKPKPVSSPRIIWDLKRDRLQLLQPNY